MEIALKQRLVGAVVLVALAVIFLPLLIKGPAPVSGAAEVPLDLPDAPKGEFQTRELPLLTPVAGSGGAVGLDPATPATSSTSEPATSEPVAAPISGMMPAATAGGDFAVSFGSYATAADAARVVAALKASQLPGYQEPYTAEGRDLHRVRIGPYSTRAEAEAARLRAAHVRDDVGSRVLTLDTDATPARDASTAGAKPEAVSKPITDMPAPKPTTEKPTASEAKPAAKPVETTVAVSKPAETKPAETKPTETSPATTEPAAPKPVAAGNVGFAVQIGAFGNAEEANRLRDRARAAGLSAFVEQVPTDRGTLSRVRLGPVADRAAAEELRAQAAARIGASGQVRPHP